MIRQAVPDVGFALVGGQAEVEFNAALLRSDPELVDAGTDNSVDLLAALIASCEWVITSDSLGYHVACAVGTPALCVVGPTSPWELDLFGTNQVVHADLDCIACYLSSCPFPTTCMDALTPASIWRGRPVAEELKPRRGVVAVAPAHVAASGAARTREAGAGADCESTRRDAEY